MFCSDFKLDTLTDCFFELSVDDGTESLFVVVFKVCVVCFTASKMYKCNSHKTSFWRKVFLPPDSYITVPAAS